LVDAGFNAKSRPESSTGCAETLDIVEEMAGFGNKGAGASKAPRQSSYRAIEEKVSVP
jgi:hypothetical protein